MKNKNLWNKISNISGYTSLVLAIIYTFFERYIEKYYKPLFVLGLVMIFVFLGSEFMKYTIKKRHN